MDHIAEKEYVGSFHYGLVHTPVSIQETMKIPEARAAVDKAWNKSKAILVLDVKNVRPKSEVIRQAKKDGQSVQVARVMDICHLKNAEFAKHLQMYKKRDVLREDNAKDEER